MALGAATGTPADADQFERDGVRRHPDADQRASGSHAVGHGFRARQQKRERPRPEGFHELAGGVGNAGHQIGEHRIVRDRPGDVDDNRIPGRSLLGGKDARDGRSVKGVGAQAVDCFGGQSDKPAFAQNLGCLCDRFARRGGIESDGIHGKAQGLHLSIVAR